MQKSAILIAKPDSGINKDERILIFVNDDKFRFFPKSMLLFILSSIKAVEKFFLKGENY